jgi:hypothetical protein
VQCQRDLSRQCPTGDRCYIEGCQQPYGPPPGTAVIRERQPIELPPLPEHQPGPLMRAVMAMTDAGASLVRRGPTPFAPDPEAILAAVAAQEPPKMSDTTVQAAPAQIPPAAPSGRAVSEIRARRIGSGWLLYANGQEVDVATDNTMGTLIADLVRQ